MPKYRLLSGKHYNGAELVAIGSVVEMSEEAFLPLADRFVAVPEKEPQHKTVEAELVTNPAPVEKRGPGRKKG